MVSEVNIFGFGFLLELFGKEWSIYLLGLGGLWEVVFAIWLIVRGSKNVKIISEHEM
jgi:thiol:disulfide interchange protein